MIPTTERFPSSSVSLYRTRLSNVYISLSFPFRLPAPRTISAHPPSAVSSYIALTFCHETHYIRFEPRCLLTDPEYCRICRTHGAVSATAAAQTKKIIKKAKKVVTNLFPYSIIQIVQFIGYRQMVRQRTLTPSFSRFESL